VRIEPVPYEDLQPDLRKRFDAGVAEGRYTTTLPLQVYAHATAHATALDESYRLTFRQGVLGDRLQELLRLRSAQLNGCAPCAGSRKESSVAEDDVACMVSGGGTLDERERRALRFLEQMCDDHFAIDDETFRSLGEVFTVPEVVELGMSCASYIGGHRWTHALDALSDAEPVLRRDHVPAAEQVAARA
jgi:alkylhydroperoxidase family enzyme